MNAKGEDKRGWRIVKKGEGIARIGDLSPGYEP
jgi:hypothetical protein